MSFPTTSRIRVSTSNDVQQRKLANMNTTKHDTHASPATKPNKKTSNQVIQVSTNKNQHLNIFQKLAIFFGLERVDPPSIKKQFILIDIADFIASSSKCNDFSINQIDNKTQTDLVIVGLKSFFERLSREINLCMIIFTSCIEQVRVLNNLFKEFIGANKVIVLKITKKSKKDRLNDKVPHYLPNQSYNPRAVAIHKIKDHLLKSKFGTIIISNAKINIKHVIDHSFTVESESLGNKRYDFQLKKSYNALRFIPVFNYHHSDGSVQITLKAPQELIAKANRLTA